jgi:hypothetical protein
MALRKLLKTMPVTITSDPDGGWNYEGGMGLTGVVQNRTDRGAGR